MALAANEVVELAPDADALAHPGATAKSGKVLSEWHPHGDVHRAPGSWRRGVALRLDCSLRPGSYLGVYRSVTTASLAKAGPRGAQRIMARFGPFNPPRMSQGNCGRPDAESLLLEDSALTGSRSS